MGEIYTTLHRHILDLANEYGVQIMTPAYEGDPEKPKVVAKEELVQRAGEGCRSQLEVAGGLVL
jgi:hypothetical protein